MAEAHIGPLPEGTKHCLVCAEPINKKAWRCIHCQSELGAWRRRLSFSSTVLALLVALVSVVGTTAPPIIEALKPKKSILFAIQGFDKEGIVIFASNPSLRQSIINGAALTFLDRRFGLALPNNFFLLKPGETAVIRLSKDESIFYVDFDLDQIKRDTPCHIEIRARDADGQDALTSFTMSCQALFPFIYTMVKGDQ